MWTPRLLVLMTSHLGSVHGLARMPCFSAAIRTGPGRFCTLACNDAVEDGIFDQRLQELREYKAKWGNADAALGDGLGRWCKTQRRLREEGRIDSGREQALTALGFSWVSPSQITNPIEECDWAGTQNGR